MEKIINLKEWKQERGYEPIGEWSIIDPKTKEVIERGLLYNGKQTYEEESK